MNLNKKRKKYKSSSSSDDEERYEYDNCSENEIAEIFDIFQKNDVTLDDLIDWGDLYVVKRRYMCSYINLKTLWKLQEPLKKLKNMVGMQSVKKNIVGQILYFLQNLESNDNMLHTIIEGPPGVGKTELGKILGEIYTQIGILKVGYNDVPIFKIVKRSDLIGKYLGHTAALTQQMIDSCYGGVMFIDEAYSLGNSEQRDSFSKECIDTINRNLTEQKSNFLCIIAGYSKDLEQCFFAYNEGLKRRFPFKYTIDPYTPNELKDIFERKVKDTYWTLNEELYDNLFKENAKHFVNYGGDMETLLFNCKVQHGIRIFGQNESYRKILTFDDIKNGMTVFLKEKEKSKGKGSKDNIDSCNMMYM